MNSHNHRCELCPELILLNTILEELCVPDSGIRLINPCLTLLEGPPIPPEAGRNLLHIPECWSTKLVTNCGENWTYQRTRLKVTDAVALPQGFFTLDLSTIVTFAISVCHSAQLPLLNNWTASK